MSLEGSAGAVVALRGGMQGFLGFAALRSE